MLNLNHPLRYESEFIKLGKLSKILQTLRKERINSVRLSISCPDKSIISHLEKNLFNPQNNPITKPMQKSNLKILGKKGIEFEKIKSMKYYKTIDLCNKLISRIFINEYRRRLQELGEEFNVYMIWDCTIIRVYSETQISSVFESQIIGLKQKLKWINYQNEKFYAKLKLSRFIGSKLQQMNIRYLFLWDNKSIIIHSSVMSGEFLKGIIHAYDYDAVILNFSNASFTPMVNRTYYKLLMLQMGQKLSQIQSNYEIKCEVNSKNMSLLMHTRDPIFSKEPIQQLNNLMGNIIFVTYWTQNSQAHLFHIRNCRPGSKCLQVMMSQTFIYTSWNRSRQILPLEVSRVYQKLLSECSLNTIVRVIFKYGALNKILIQNVEYLAEKYKLHSFPPQFQDERQQIIHIKFKSFNVSNRDKKVLQLNYFLQELITKNTNQISIPPIFTNNLQNHKNHHSIELNNLSRKPDDLKKQPLIQQNFKYFYYKYQSPLIKRGQQCLSTPGTRNRQLQDHISSIMGVASRIWSMVFELNEDKFEKPDEGQMCKLYVTQRTERDDGISIKKADEIDFKSLKQGIEYFLVYKLQRTCKYFLGFKMKIYNNT